MTITETTELGLHAERIHPTIGAVVSGVDASRPLDDDTLTFFHQAVRDHKVVFLRDQHLDLAQQEAFGRQFGDLWFHPVADGYPDFAWLVQDSGIRTRADNWHADATFVENPPWASILQLLVVPEIGGDTLFADLEAAYDGLSEPVKLLVDDLVVEHDGRTFAPWAFGPNLGDDRRAEILEVSNKRVDHPLVRTDPVTGRKSLYSVTGFARRIKGLTEEESDGLLALLHDHVTRPEYIVRFKWNAGDIAFWDNRRVLHRAANDYGTAERKLQRVTVTEFAR